MPLFAFLFSRMCSVFGMQILACTYIFRLVENGINPLGLSQLGLVATVASLGMAFPTGMLVDKIPKRNAILISHALLLGVVVIAAFRNSSNFLEILVITALVASARNFRSISQFTVFGELLHAKENKTSWVNFSTLSWQIAAFAAPILAGILGSGQKSLILASAFIGASLITQFYIVRHLSTQPGTTPTAAPEITSGIISHLRSNFKLRSALLLDFFIVLFAGASTLLPFLHADKITTLELGILKSALPAGVIFGTFLNIYKASSKKRLGNELENWSENLFLATVGYGFCHFLLADSPTLIISFGLLFGAGIFDAISLAVRECILQLETPVHLKGRIYSVNNFLVNASDELSEWESGLAAHWFGVRSAIKISGAVALLGAGVFLLKSKKNGGKNPPSLISTTHI